MFPYTKEDIEAKKKAYLEDHYHKYLLYADFFYDMRIPTIPKLEYQNKLPNYCTCKEGKIKDEFWGEFCQNCIWMSEYRADWYHGTEYHWGDNARHETCINHNTNSETIQLDKPAMLGTVSERVIKPLIGDCIEALWYAIGDEGNFPEFIFTGIGTPPEEIDLSMWGMTNGHAYYPKGAIAKNDTEDWEDWYNNLEDREITQVIKKLKAEETGDKSWME